MADINEVITLGIGAPSDITHFILFGLSASGAVGPASVEAGIIEVVGNYVPMIEVTGEWTGE